MNIGSNIAQLRKAKQWTQEQLASAVGVSAAAVSKWESGSTYPDIALLPSIASNLEVSIDRLLDYSVPSDRLAEIRSAIRRSVQNSDYAAGLPLAEEAIKRYPNDFDLLLSLGHLKLSKGTADEQVDAKKAIEEAIFCFQRALRVRPPDAPIDIVSIKQHMAFAYQAMEEHDKAISILHEINTNHTLDLEIALNQIRAGRRHVAMPILQYELYRMAFHLPMVIRLLGECFAEDHRRSYAADLQVLHAEFLDHFTHETPHYFDLLCAISCLDVAKYQKDENDFDGMWRSMKKSVNLAIRFDRNPSYEIKSIKYMEGLKGWVANNSAENACHQIRSRLQSDFAEFEQDKRYQDYMQQLKVEARNKRESGIWQ
nr:helix-turn-helix transcriptional regulator [Cohnella sp. REN36]